MNFANKYDKTKEDLIKQIKLFKKESEECKIKLKYIRNVNMVCYFCNNHRMQEGFVIEKENKDVVLRYFIHPECLYKIR